MKLARVTVIKAFASIEGKWRAEGSTFTCTLAEALKYGASVRKDAVLDEPDVEPLAPPKAGNLTEDGPPQHRMMTRLNSRNAV